MPARLSLCVIARDAAESLKECLASAQGVVDEMLVVDTGSRDATPEVARRLGAQVYHYPWQDDFAAARNFALQHARGEWVLFLDADEALYPEDGPLLRELLKKAEVEAYFLSIHNLVDERGRQVVSPAVRLFRRRPEYRWAGRVHEQILPSIVAAGKGRVEMAGVRVRHRGYLPGEVARHDKVRRNLRLLELELAERPGDAFVLFNLGVEKQRSGRLAEALTCFEQARQGLAPGFSFAHLLEKRRIDCLIGLGRLEEAVAAARAAQEVFPAYTDLVYQEGVALAAQGRLEEARDAFRRCLEMGDAPPWFTGEKGAGGWRALLALAGVLCRLGEGEAAGKACLQVLALTEGGEEEAACLLLDLLRQTGAEPWAEDAWGALVRRHLDLVAEQVRSALKRWPELGPLRQVERIMAGPRPTLSLCMIVRDEADVLGRCLASVCGAVEEILVGDTGSRDHTPEVARRYGARVYSLPWTEDFAAARNAVLEKAAGDWVLVLDADEELRREDIPALRRLLWREDAEAYCLRVVNYYGPAAGPDFVTDNVCRLFRRRPAYRFRGRLHEQVVDSIRETAGAEAIKFCGVTVYHYGYLDARVRAKDKGRRNRALLRRALAAEPANPYWQYALAVEDFQEGRYASALARLDGIEPAASAGYASDVAYKKAICLMELGRLDAALAWLETSLCSFPGFTDLLFLKAEILRRQQRWEEAAVAYRQCLAWGDAPARYSGVNGVGTFRAWYGLGLALEQAGRKEEAVAAWRQAWQACPGWPEPLYPLARLLCREAGERAAAAELERQLLPLRAGDYLRLAEVLAAAGAYGLAREYLAIARERGESGARLEALERTHARPGAPAFRHAGQIRGAL